MLLRTGKTGFAIWRVDGSASSGLTPGSVQPQTRPRYRVMLDKSLARFAWEMQRTYNNATREGFRMSIECVLEEDDSTGGR